MGIIKCRCNHEFQDKRYGKGNRIHNQTTKSNGRIYRCTVCRNETEHGKHKIEDTK